MFLDRLVFILCVHSVGNPLATQEVSVVLTISLAQIIFEHLLINPLVLSSGRDVTLINTL